MIFSAAILAVGDVGAAAHSAANAIRATRNIRSHAMVLSLPTIKITRLYTEEMLSLTTASVE